jgi:TRAP transporter TAXI family solute receptor
MRKFMLSALAAGIVAAWATASSAQQPIDIPWGTSIVGSSGHKALVTMATVLNREMPKYRITVQPTPGAVVTMKGFATGQFKGFYGSDVGFYEMANDTLRFKGFKGQIKHQSTQSFWAYTIEVGVAVHARDKDKIKQWRDLAGKRVFTGAPPWDVRAHLERAFTAIGIKHEYVPVDVATAGSLLDSGRLASFIVYTTAETAPAPWIVEASLSTDWAALNPSPEEVKLLEKAGFSFVDIKADAFKRDTHTSTLKLSPFFYGFHVGLDIPEADVYQMLIVIEKNAAELAKSDGSFAQVATGMAQMQKRGVASSVEFVPVHPGLAKYMRERGVWDPKWDKRVANASN